MKRLLLSLFVVALLVVTAAAVLPDADRATTHAEFMRALSADGDPIDVSEPDLRAAFNATDDWIDANAASYNAALPLPARTALTARQKVRLFLFVAERRWEVEP